MTTPDPSRLDLGAAEREQRLRDLTALTRAYGRAGGPVNPVGWIVGGLCLLVMTTLLGRGLVVAASVPLLALALAQLAASHLTRGWYQRLGLVAPDLVERDADGRPKHPRWEGGWPFMVALGPVVFGLLLWHDLRAVAVGDAVAVSSMGFGCSLATIVLARRVTPRRWAEYCTGSFILQSMLGLDLHQAAERGLETTRYGLGLLTFVGLLGLLAGLWSHLDHRKVERRLEALLARPVQFDPTVPGVRP